MRKVKDKIAQQLFDALYEANLADALDFEGEKINDLPDEGSKGDHLYGYLTHSLRTLGFDKQLEEFFQTGDKMELQND